MTAKRAVGTKIKIGSTFIAGLTSIGAPPKTADTLDTTTLDSDGGYRTFTGGFKDGGEISISGYFEPGDAGQLALDTAFESGDVTDFQIIFPTGIGATWAFSGVVTGFTGGDAELESLLAFEATIKVSGKPVLGTSASVGLSALTLTGTGGTMSPSFATATTAYIFDGVTASSITVTATGVGQTILLYIDGAYSAELTSGTASDSIALTADEVKTLTIVAYEDNKVPVVYEIAALKPSA